MRATCSLSRSSDREMFIPAIRLRESRERELDEKPIISRTRQSARLFTLLAFLEHAGPFSRPAAQWRIGNKLRIRGRFASGRANCRRPATPVPPLSTSSRTRFPSLTDHPSPEDLTCFHARETRQRREKEREREGGRVGSNSRVYVCEPGGQRRMCIRRG